MATLPIVGARYRPPAQEVLSLLPLGTKLLLRRQPDNPYDENAVQVLVPGYPFGEVPDDVNTALTTSGVDDINVPFHLGFIPREAAKELAPKMDAPKSMVHVEGQDGEYPVNVEPVSWPALLTFGLTGLPSVSFEEPKS